MLFSSRSGDSLRWKGRFHRQETAVFESRNDGSWKWFLFLSASKTPTVLIISILHAMPKIRIFRNQTTTRRQISAVCMLRTAFLLILFAFIVGAWFITFHPVRWAYFVPLERLFVFPKGRRNVINHAPTAGALVFCARRNVINHTPQLAHASWFMQCLSRTEVDYHYKKRIHAFGMNPHSVCFIRGVTSYCRLMAVRCPQLRPSSC